jgi:hypothetical protein
MKKLVHALVLLALVSGAALLVLWVAFGSPANGIHLVINEHEVQWADLRGWHAAAGGLALLFALCIVALVLSLTLMLGLLLPLLFALVAVLLALGAVLGAGALTLSPLLLLVLLVWWLSRRSSRRAAPTRVTKAAAEPHSGP